METAHVLRPVRSEDRAESRHWRSGHLRELEYLAIRANVPLEDVLLIALNLWGAITHPPHRRARLIVTLHRAPRDALLVIVPLDKAASPFRVYGDELWLDSSVIGNVTRVDADEAIGGYFRADGTVVTLNPNSRSRCVGCAFCPNTLEAAADPRLHKEKDLAELLEALGTQHPNGHLRGLREVTVSTGCFEREDLALAHLRALRHSLRALEIEAKIGFLTSVVRTRSAFEQIADEVAPFLLYLTAECFTRREVLLKATKASLTPEEMPALLACARQAGLDTSLNYIVGLESLDVFEKHMKQLANHLTVFPNLQVYQAHHPLMAVLRFPGAEDVAFYLEARRRAEEIFRQTGLRPEPWRCYRPLWYFSYDNEYIAGPHI